MTHALTPTSVPELDHTVLHQSIGGSRLNVGPMAYEPISPQISSPRNAYTPSLRPTPCQRPQTSTASPRWC